MPMSDHDRARYDRAVRHAKTEFDSYDGEWESIQEVTLGLQSTDAPELMPIYDMFMDRFNALGEMDPEEWDHYEYPAFNADQPQKNPYEGCEVGEYQGNPTITINPQEPKLYKRLNFGRTSVQPVLEKMAQIEQFVRDGGSTTPEGCEVFEYRGNKMLLINPNDIRRVQFGLEKATIIVQRKKALEQFFLEHR